MCQFPGPYRADVMEAVKQSDVGPGTTVAVGKDDDSDVEDEAEMPGFEG